MRRILFFIAVATIWVGASSARAAMVSTMETPAAVTDAHGFAIVPVQELRVSGDEGAARVYEIIRPNGEGFTIGRLNTSCTCVRLETRQSSYAPGERAFITLRNIRPTPPEGRMYTFYVQVTSPVRATLRGDTFVQSERFRRNRPLVPTGSRYGGARETGSRGFYR